MRSLTASQREVKGGQPVSYDEIEDESLQAEQDGLRARSEQAIGELAQALIESPTVHNAIAAAFGAREKAIEAQHAAMSALNLPSAGDVERLERRLRSLSQRLEEVEEQLDEANQEIGGLRRRLAAEKKPPSEKKAAKTAKD
jgi:chromosome segregation ATPase